MLPNEVPASNVPHHYYENDVFIGSPNTTSILAPPINPTLPLPPPSSRTNVELNLSVLKRYLPATKSILLIAPYAALYSFLPSAEQWEKSSIQGTLFVVGLASPASGPERYAIIILNRLGLENFVLELRPGADVDLEEEIVVVRGGGGVEEDGMIWGLWIFEEGDEKSTAGMRGEVERVVRSCVEATWPAGEHDSNGNLVGDGHSHTHGDGDYVNGAHVSPIDPPPEQPQHQPLPRTSPEASIASAQAQSSEPQPGQDILGALFHRAMLNYRGS